MYYYYFLISLPFIYYFYVRKTKKVNAFITDKDHKPRIKIDKITIDNLKNVYKFIPYFELKLTELLLESTEQNEQTEQKRESVQQLENSDLIYIDIVDELRIIFEKSKIYIDYHLNNEEYTICLYDIPYRKQTKNKNPLLLRKVIGAEMMDSLKNYTDISKDVLNYQGPSYDFYKDIYGVSTNVSDLFPYMSNDDVLYIHDIFGDTNVYHYYDNIKWISGFF